MTQKYQRTCWAYVNSENDSILFFKNVSCYLIGIQTAFHENSLVYAYESTLFVLNIFLRNIRNCLRILEWIYHFSDTWKYLVDMKRLGFPCQFLWQYPAGIEIYFVTSTLTSTWWKTYSNGYFYCAYCSRHGRNYDNMKILSLNNNMKYMFSVLQ